MAYDLGENGVMFKISRDGKIQFNPQASIISTSHEMEVVIKKIVPEVMNYFEFLLQKELKKGGV